MNSCDLVFNYLPLFSARADHLRLVKWTVALYATPPNGPWSRVYHVQIRQTSAKTSANSRNNICRRGFLADLLLVRMSSIVIVSKLKIDCQTYMTEVRCLSSTRFLLFFYWFAPFFRIAAFCNLCRLLCFVLSLCAINLNSEIQLVNMVSSLWEPNVMG